VSAGAPARASFFTRADADNYLGLLAMIASLRAQGYGAPVTVLDLGLTTPQRDALGLECIVVSHPRAHGRHPFLLGAFPYLLGATGAVVYVDADVILTSSLDPILDAVEHGMVYAAPDITVGRCSPEWADRFGLTAPLRPQVYVNSGFVALSTDHHPDLLGRWWECCERLPPPPAVHDPRPDPVGFGEQDALNALLMSEVPAGRLELAPSTPAVQGARQLRETTVVDLERLACRYRGLPTLLLHPVGRPKPWQDAARRELERNAYTRCLRELVTRAPARTRTGVARLPPWLEPGTRGATTLSVVSATNNARARVKRSRLALGKARLRWRQRFAAG
jgi:hypothetical protein